MIQDKKGQTPHTDKHCLVPVKISGRIPLGYISCPVVTLCSCQGRSVRVREAVIHPVVR